MNIGKYVMRVLITIDQSTNTLFGGEPDETISSRWGREQGTTKIAKIGCWVLDKIQKDHCKKSVEFLPDGEPDPHHLQEGKEKT